MDAVRRVWQQDIEQGYDTYAARKFCNPYNRMPELMDG